MDLPNAPEIGQNLLNYFAVENISQVIRAFLIALIGFPLIYLFARIVRSALGRNFTKHFQLLAHKIVIYLGSLLIIASVLVQLGFDISTILGALAIIAIALGFAAQSSLSNVVTGIFLFWEEPFAVGDIIEVKEMLGYVLSIDLLSVKIRTFNNHYIRIPNEQLIKNEFINHSRFPIRRLDLDVRVSVDEDLSKTFAILEGVKDTNSFTLEEPQAWLAVRSFQDNYIDVHFGIWVDQANYFNLKRVILKEIKEALNAEGISIPAQQIAIHQDLGVAGS